MTAVAMSLQEAIEKIGSRYKIAKILNDHGFKITLQSVYDWEHVVPELRAYQLREICPDKFSCKNNHAIQG